MFGKPPQSDDDTQQDSPTSKFEHQLPAMYHEQQAKDLLAQLQQQADARVGKSSVKAAVKTLSYIDQKLETPSYKEAKKLLIEDLLSALDFAAIERLPKDLRKSRVKEASISIIANINLPLTQAQIDLLKEQAIDEVMGYGPLEPLLSDSEVSDIMINTADQIFIEKSGHLYLTDIRFLNEKHLMGVVQRIVSRVGRRVDESSPMVDARLPDGSRFNAIIPPLALDGALVSIRKFKQHKMSLSEYIELGSMSKQMATFLEICSKIRLNSIISGGTGSGKTTLLNAMSGHISNTERVITIEDAAELQLNQSHVLRLETRPASIEGVGEVTQRALVKNALRMRPDRIILGEIRGDEVIDVLSAMNTGHDGSMATIHSNSPKDCLARIENLVGMSGVSIATSSLRYQISSAVQVICQLMRMRDGRRRITQIDEVVGVENGEIKTQTLFYFEPHGMNENGELAGEFVCTRAVPGFINRAHYFGLEAELRACLEP